MFQSTLPRGERLGVMGLHSLFQQVSIHAPAWGATSISLEQARFSFSFNPRSRVGSDTFNVVGTSGDVGFNPRSRVGSDARTSWLCEFRLAVSIHAPAWGATRAGRLVRGRGLVSIHAPAWGATPTRLTLFA